MSTTPVTIVIPTYNRHHLLGRTLRHYDGFGVPVLVVDSTPVAFTDLEGLANTQYLHVPDEPMPHKLRAPVLERVRTPYMVMSADDSFTCLSGIRSCVEFLEANPDYSSAHGYYLGFWDRGGDIELDVYYRSLENLETVVDSDRPQERLIQHFTRYNCIFYATFRTPCMAETLSRFPDVIRNYCIMEFYFAMMQIVHGKHKLLPIFYQLQEHVPGIGRDETFRNDLHRLATKPRYIPEFDPYVEAVAAYLAEKSGRPLYETRVYVMKAVALQSWKRKMQKSLPDRIGAECLNLLNKTVFKKRKQRQTQLKRAAEKAQRQDVVAAARALIGEAGWAELNALLRSLTGKAQ